jgi:hypothetical protein
MGKKNINTRIKPTQFHFVYHKSHMIWPGSKLRLWRMETDE